MSFSLETTEMDLGDTPIENIFINDFMPMANGTYVKVYLLGYKYAHDRDPNMEVSNKSIANNLDIPLEDVLRAWDFWEKKGIIQKEMTDSINYQVKFLNLKQLYIDNNYKVVNTQVQKKEDIATKADYSQKDLIEANQIPIVNSMFNQVDYFMRRQTTPFEKRQILDWIHDYNMNPDVIEKAFYFAVEHKGKRNIKYVGGIIRNWYDEGLTNLEAVIEYYKERDEKFYRYQRIMKSIGLSDRPIREDEKRTIDIWFNVYKFDMDIVLKACEADKNPRPSVNYINAILKSWHEKEVKTIEDIDLLERPKVATKPINNQRKKTTSVKTRFHNFEQRTEKYSSDELEDIARKKREEYSQRLKGDS